MSSTLAAFIYHKRMSKNDLILNVPEIRSSVDKVLGLICPQRGRLNISSEADAEMAVQVLKREMQQAFIALSALKPSLLADANRLVEVYFEQLPSLAEVIDRDAEAAYEGDPAAYSVEEVVVTYPGFYAVAVYRLAHALNKLGVPLLPRLFSEYAHERTGIDIHPGATIGESFFIDHGTGVVIGETSHIGKNVKIYQGVTLGALSVKKRLQSVKRHPTIEDDVVIYANCTILGGETVIGRNSVVGGNVWLTHSVPEGSRIFNEQDQSQKKK